MAKQMINKKDKIIHLNGRRGEAPVIYLRYYNDELRYVGETTNYWHGRPFRYEKGEGYEINKVRCLNASPDEGLRRKWEAKLIVKLKPSLQKERLGAYVRKANLDYKCSEDRSILQKRNSIHLVDWIDKKYLSIWKAFYTFHIKRFDQTSPEAIAKFENEQLSNVHSDPLLFNDFKNLDVFIRNCVHALSLRDFLKNNSHLIKEREWNYLERRVSCIQWMYGEIQMSFSDEYEGFSDSLHKEMQEKWKEGTETFITYWPKELKNKDTK
tara:strand:+ start:34 stop:837 length:804 start_codon:yes stop_codon:yes gene_type:complete